MSGKANGLMAGKKLKHRRSGFRWNSKWYTKRMLNLKEKGNYKKILGKSFLPFIYGREEERIAYSETGGLGGPTPSPEQHNVKCIRTNKWKLIYNETNKKKELYNLEQDKEENNNLIGKEPEIEKYLWEKMIEEGKTFKELTIKYEPGFK